MVTCQSSELDWEVTVELPVDFLSLGRGSVIVVLYSSILSSFHFKSKHAIFIKQCFCTIFNDQYSTIRIYKFIQ